jgi:hypothetical protein
MKTPDELAAIAVELVLRVRDVEDPEANGTWLAERLPEPADWFRLAFALAAAIPDDRSWTALTAWTLLRHGVEPEYDEGEVLRPAPSATPKPERALKPCGTEAAAARHQARGEDMDDECREALRTVDRERKRERRAAA